MAKIMFQKGNVPWNKGKTGVQIPWNKGNKRSLPNCLDCGKQLSDPRVRRCASCGAKDRNKHYISPMKGVFGSNHPGWRGGITPIGSLIRGLVELNEWRTKILRRDNFTCQKCKQYGGYLEVHHKKGFSIILKTFLQEYDQFSPIEDKETLLRLATKWEPFLDINNGLTLCRDCHEKTDNYAGRTAKCHK